MCRSHGGWQWQREVGSCLSSWVQSAHTVTAAFPLEPGCIFVETKDWRADIKAKWGAVGADDRECFPVVHVAQFR